MSPVNYAGAAACQSCHAAQFTAWKGSHHDQSMQQASNKTVLGDFHNASYTYNGVTTKFFMRDGKFMVHTDDQDGVLRDFLVKYTFGVYPLQQYLIDVSGGRLQALSISWDARPTQEGGQRWFHLYPGEKINHKDELHWTKLSQNWNHMCSQCHSTNLRKGFDLASNSFDTKWSEINVSCESCHGPASRHVDLAKSTQGFANIENFGLTNKLDGGKGVAWIFAPEAKIAHRSSTPQNTTEIETCAGCHSRRSELIEGKVSGKHLMDSHLPSLLNSPYFYPDGQIKEEDFEYASFLQSKMFHNGVTCSDCHEPHSQKLRAPGNETCFGCHKASEYASKRHHHHLESSPAAECVSCHMPTTNFMVVHARHDHSLRIPRPDLSIKIKTPNACNQCHVTKSAKWAVEKMENWYGQAWSENWHFGETLHAANLDLPGATQDLLALAVSQKLPDIARATAASGLPRHVDQAVFVVLPKLLHDRSPMVRREALATLETMPYDRRWALAGHTLSDPILAVRIEAARVLAPVPRETLTSEDKNRLDHGIQEYIDVAMSSAEHPQSHVNLGLLYLSQGDRERAEKSYQNSIRLDPSYHITYINLADLYVSYGDELKAKVILIKGQSLMPDNADIQHALGLFYVRQKQNAQALPFLAKASRTHPDNARYGYVYAVALFEHGDREEALTLLSNQIKLHPYDGDLMMAMVAYNIALGRPADARKYANRLLKIAPTLGSVEQIMKLELN
jgi:predicted CXXCH cytochrome family protein